MTKLQLELAPLGNVYALSTPDSLPSSDISTKSRHWYVTIINGKNNYDRFVPASIGDILERDGHHKTIFIYRGEVRVGKCCGLVRGQK